MFKIKQGDTLPHLQVQLVDAEDKPVNLQLSGVMFHMKDRTGKVVINRPATITDELEGNVSVEWLKADTKDIGAFKAEFQVTFPDNNVLTIPNDKYLSILIYGELA